MRIASGSILRTISAARRSCAGFSTDQTKEMATVSTPSLANSSQASRTSASFIGVRTEPSEITRSRTPFRR